jgi:hypothetical protein
MSENKTDMYVCDVKGEIGSDSDASDVRGERRLIGVRDDRRDNYGDISEVTGKCKNGLHGRE